MSFNIIYDKFLHKIVEKTNPYLGELRRRQGGIKFDFTIIFNNCWAGNVYRWYNIPYLTPTAGLYFFADDYIRFLSRFNYYTSLMPEQIPVVESKHIGLLRKRGQTNVPIGRLDDVEIIFLHYPTFEEAKEKWVRRTARINWGNLIVKNSQMNECTEANIKEFDKLPFDRKFIFTTRDYGIDSQIIYKDKICDGMIADDTVVFNRYVNVRNLVCGKPFKKI